MPGRQRSAVRRGATVAVAAAVICAVAPLCLIQAPNAIAWAMPGPGVTGAAPAAVLRASGLALPAMASVAGIAAVAARRLRAWPVLITGLLVMALADALGGSVHTAGMIGLDRALHGLAAGIAMPAALALAWERSPRVRSWLAALWSVVTVIGLVAASAVVRYRLRGGDWHAVLRPCPWLTGAALAAAAVYALLSAGNQSREGGRREAGHERAQLAVLAVPGIGLSVLCVAVSYRQPAALPVTASAGLLVLCGIAAAASADKVIGGPFPLIGAVAGLAVAPAAGAITSVRVLAGAQGAALAGAASPAWLPVAGVAAATVAGAAIGLAVQRRRVMVVAGLAVAAAGLVAVYAAGPLATGPVLADAGAPVAGGLAAAMTAALAGATAASALSGVALLLAGMLAGYVAAGSVQARMVARLAGPAVRTALNGAAGRWELAGAAALAIVITAIIIADRARREGARTRSRG